MTPLTGPLPPARERPSLVIVTISREYGAAGLGVARALAARLGYGLLTDDLPRSVAERLGTSAEVVSSRAGSEPTLLERIVAKLREATPDTVVGGAAPGDADFDDAVVREIERTVRARADVGDVVILGRNAGAILRDRAGVVRVFLRADRTWRVERICAQFGIPAADALADAERVDASRKVFARDRYGVRWGDAREYDLVLDVGRLGIERAVDVVAAAVRGPAS